VKVIDENDHKPLEIILKKSLHDAPLRLQRMLLRLQKYDFTNKHKPGKDFVVADTLSRAPLLTTDPELEKEISFYVHMVMSNLPATDDIMARLRMATEEDLFNCQTTFLRLDRYCFGKREPRTYCPKLLRYHENSATSWRSIRCNLNYSRIIRESAKLYVEGDDVVGKHRSNIFASARAKEYDVSKVVDCVDSFLGHCPFFAYDSKKL
jgi:hypothetical protein